MEKETIKILRIIIAIVTLPLMIIGLGIKWLSYSPEEANLINKDFINLGYYIIGDWDKIE